MLAPLRCPGIGVIDDASVTARESRDLRHFRMGKLEIGNGEIFREPLEGAGARDDRDAALHQEAQAHLHRALAMRLADARKHFVPADAASGHRTISHDGHAVAPAGRDHLRLVNEGMYLDLVADERLGCKLHGLFDERNGKVRYPDVASQTRALDLAQGAERIAQWDLWVWPMQQEQVDLAKPQSRQALLRGTLKIARSKMRRPDLGGDEDLIASDARAAKPFTSPEAWRTANRMRGRGLEIVLAARGMASVHAVAQEFNLATRNHRFEPQEIRVPAGKRVSIYVTNEDASAEEFESPSLKVEKVIPGKSKGVVRIGPLTPGRYEFFGDFHADTAKGVVIAE